MKAYLLFLAFAALGYAAPASDAVPIITTPGLPSPLQDRSPREGLVQASQLENPAPSLPGNRALPIVASRATPNLSRAATPSVNIQEDQANRLVNATAPLHRSQLVVISHNSKVPGGFLGILVDLVRFLACQSL
ncbi:hypothetical protein JX266_013111 [Neoarthrinium moseri]|nr:hypothetical protein JX266_013111 [Neoarthrinium moseri]